MPAFGQRSNELKARLRSSQLIARLRSSPLIDRLAPLLTGLAALLAGTAGAWFYSAGDLAISHFDARAHLVVARRILDSLTPGWQQIGAVWLPLPHVLNMLPVQVDAWYRSGVSAIGISVMSSGVAAWALSRFIQTATGSAAGGVAGAALLLANANLLYIQSTPMTEPLLLATALLSLALTATWIDRGAHGWPWGPGLALTATCLTRYEGWLMAASAIVLTSLVLLRRGTPLAVVIRASLKLSVIPIIAIVLFTANSRWTIGSWFIPRDFFVPENDARGNAGLAWKQVIESVYLLSGPTYVWPGYAGALGVALAFVLSRRRSMSVLILALAAAAALPWYAYLQGHPVRVRYGLLLVAACAALAGTGIGLIWRPLRAVAAAALAIVVFFHASPFNRNSLLVIESRRDSANTADRQAVTAYLRTHYHGESPIMMSMGSLAHYMHDLGRAGFDIHSFLHEGNGEVWQYAVLGPRGYVTWLVMEERAEGGDVLFHAAQRDPRYLEGFERVAEGGGIALYKATPPRP
jgi:hypothetical protein